MTKRLTRSAIPHSLPRATRFSDDATNASAHALIAQVKGMPVVLEPLRQAALRAYKWGPDRMPGEWALLYLAFVISRIPDIQPWYQRICHDRSLWELCGFGEQIPAYQTVYQRLVDLERCAPAFEAAAASLIQKARARDPRIGSWCHIDASEAETHAAPQHDCLPTDGCPTSGFNRQPRMGRLPSNLAADVRRASATGSEDTADEQVAVAGIRPLAISDAVVDSARKGVRFASGRHHWFSRDPDAGARAYTVGGRVRKAWHGYLHVEVVDHYASASLASFLIPANVNESKAYERALDTVTRNCGGVAPLAVAGDKGYSIKSIFELNTRRGIASVFPYRRPHATAPVQAAATNTYDEHGVPRCRHCGGGTDFSSFAVERRQPRLWFYCVQPQVAACRQRQSISCSENFTRLLPLWRTHEAYAALRESHFTYEHTHRDPRIQYLVAPDCLAIRPKRIGMAWQQLRSSAAMLVQWLHAFARLGWDRNEDTATPVVTSGGRVLGSINRRRGRLGLSGGGRARPGGLAPPLTT